MAEDNSQNVLSTLISVYLTDYGKVRDEIRMRITQRHQFTNYSLLLFAGIFSVMAAVLGQGEGDIFLRFKSLRSEYLLFLLVAPYIFYALLFMYMRHDFYIYYLTIFLEKDIARPVRRILRKHPSIRSELDCSYVLGYEKFIQEIRRGDMTPRMFILVKTFSDNLMKHFPFLLPVIILVGICSIAIFCGNYHEIMMVFLSFDIISFAIIVAYTHISLRRLIKARTYSIATQGLLGASC